MYPVCVIARETTSGYDTVNMGMMLQLLIPGMQDAEKADFRSEVPGIRGDLDQSLRAGTEEEPIDHLLVLQCQRSQLMWQREYNMRITRRQQFSLSCFKPAFASLTLTLRAVSVPA